MYLMLLEKLMGYCEAQAQYELGIIYGTRILHYDAAHERTHQRLMRLHYLDGNRTAALRQFQLCATTLATELAVKPDEYTLLLYQQLCNDKLDDLPRPVRLAQKPHDATPSPWQDILVRLRHFHTVLADIQRQVSQEIQAIEEIVRPHR
jgi:DNA-binding SARP family transcriptional activator